ncbi:hypothetical protein [Streptomyces sp. V4I2]|uniref:hypothetical protein n=1 Tax=Streptomyces sp. V4I2 TaxID=3042280 RepID=UPI00278B7F7A|nr:hypothetical protein [Streptomyces sp. V4I2]MDQ1045148.1 hypothetical protein [Streptomyces sp. V4I2]
MRTRATTLTATALLVTALTACSSSEDNGDDAAADSSSASSPAAEESSAPGDDGALQQAVEDYTTAYFDGDDDTAYEALSERCQGKITPEAYTAVIEQAAADHGDGHPATDVQAEVSGDLARVSYKVEGLPKFDQESQPWAREGGDWKYDAC